MADDLEDSQFWLPSHFLDDDDHPPDTTTNNEEEEEVVVEEEQVDKNKSSPRDGDRRKGSMAFSPPSTLYGMGSWSTSSREGSSPPSPLGGRDDPWDLPKPDEQGESHQRSPEAKQQTSTSWGEGRSLGVEVGLPLGLSASAWPLPQPGPNAGMRAIFLQRGGQKETTGTGVFHPRSTNVGPEPRTKTKPACSTVLLPAKVVQALNGHGRLTVGSGLDPDAIFTHNVTLLQKRGLLPRLSPSQPAPSEVVVANQEIGLPSEWTYN